MIQSHIKKKSEGWIRDIRHKFWLPNGTGIMFADRNHYMDYDPLGSRKGTHRVIYHEGGSGLCTTHYAVMNMANYEIISKHRMQVHADHKCAQCNHDRDRTYYIRKSIARLPRGGRLRDY